MQLLKKVVVIGPESTGKSTLCEYLAGYYKTGWVPEFAREYLLSHGMEYRYQDLLTIARGQLLLEDEISLGSAGKPLLFIDTDMYVMKIWCEFVFGKVHPWITDQIAFRKYDLYLLCNTDLPWVKDELREYPDLETREKLFRMYRDLMDRQNTSWVEIRGNDDQRMKIAREAVDKLVAG
ncbi:MAG TPA: AAA family ATPase [Puia sp.]|jgi:NadR type nicotinamide-nucleotide adenylyltransferase|nr:AAA family ATPase [Puia sp.]